MKKNAKKFVALLLTLLVVFALAGCGAAKGDYVAQTITVKNGATLGEGSKTLQVEVVDGEGKSASFTVKTDEKTVGEALQKLQVLSGEEGPYGLYIKEVNGILADYEKDATYWGFYINGDYAMTGADMTDAVDGDSYLFKVEK